MRKLIVLLSIFVYSCNHTPGGKAVITEVHKKADTPILRLPIIGEKIQGDFDGDGQVEVATAIKFKEGKGNPVEDGTADEYIIQFSGKVFTKIKSGCCDIRLINEGDLNNDGADDLSVFQAPVNGCGYSMTTYSYSKGKWHTIVEPFLIPTGCEHFSDIDLQKRVFKEKNVIYYWDTDPNDENGQLIKKAANTK